MVRRDGISVVDGLGPCEMSIGTSLWKYMLLGGEYEFQGREGGRSA